MAEPYYGGIDPRSRLGRGLSGLEEDLGTAGEIGGTVLNQLGEAYNPLETFRRGVGEVGDAIYGLVAPPPEPKRSPMPRGPERPLPPRGSGITPSTLNPLRDHPEMIMNLDNPLGLPPMRIPGGAGSYGNPAAVDAPSAAPKPSGGYRAVRMPDGRVVFTNLGGEGERGEEESRAAAQQAGFMRSSNPPPIEPKALPETIGAAGDPSFRRLFARDNNIADVQSRELVERADAAHRAGRRGQAEPWELKPTDQGGFTPGYSLMKEHEAADTTEMMNRRAGVADAAARAKLAEAWAKMTPEDRLRAEAALKAAEKPNFPLQTIEYLQQQMAQLDQREGAIRSGLKLITNTESPDAKRLLAEGAAKLAEIEQQRQRIIQIGGLPFKSDPLGALLAGAGYPQAQPGNP